MQRLGARLRMARPVVLLESCLAEVPVVIGYLRPVILMPVGLMAGLPVGQVEAILLHELAHIRRYDYLVNLMQVFVEGLLFYHPAVWWISSVMRSEREHCCDDLVVQVTGGAHEYATALAKLEKFRGPREAMAATGGDLMKRVQRLLGREDRRWAGLMPVFSAAVMTVGLAAAMVWTPSGTVARTPGHHVVFPAPADASLFVVHPPTLLAQARGATQAPKPAPTQTAPPTDRQTTDPKKELETPYKKWLDEDVVYIISQEEKQAFQQLNSGEERQQFVEQFWLRRDPTPLTTENEFKAEFYRRIAYANEHFAAPGIAGWRTDRGRIYIQYGPPDELEAHPGGGTLQRPAEQGGGTTQTYPFEQWRYRYIFGIGENIIIEFIDPNSTGEYRMTMDPTEKDLLLRVRPQ